MVIKNDKLLYSKCCQYALKYISAYPKTEKELTIKLQQKWYNEKEISNTMNYLKEKWYADDKIFIESYIRSELVNKWKPIINIRAKLHQKWADANLVNQILKEYKDDINIGISQKIKKEIEMYKKRDIEWFDIIHKLMRKGYHLDDIKNVIEKNRDNI